MIKWGSTMSTPDDYRAMAEECFRRAQRGLGWKLLRRWIAAQDFLLCRHAIGDSKHATHPVFVLLLLLMSAFGALEHFGDDLQHVC